MAATGAFTTERELVETAVRVLTSRLPTSWTVKAQPSAMDPEAADLLIGAPSSGGQVLVLVEATVRAAPRDIEALLGGPWRRLRRKMGNQPILFVAPYVGERVRNLLVEENVSYVDLTGNVRISLDYPGIFIETEGATSDPSATKQRSSLRGAKAGCVVRALVDNVPPFSAAEIAAAARVNEGYLSRILATLRDEGLIDRASFGPVTRVDWAALLRRRAQSADLFRRGRSLRYVARQGAAAVLEDLRQRPPSSPPPTVTGSFAAARLAPVAAPTLLVAGTMNVLVAGNKEASWTLQGPAGPTPRARSGPRCRRGGRDHPERDGQGPRGQLAGERPGRCLREGARELGGAAEVARQDQGGRHGGPVHVVGEELAEVRGSDAVELAAPRGSERHHDEPLHGGVALSPSAPHDGRRGDCRPEQVARCDPTGT